MKLRIYNFDFFRNHCAFGLILIVLYLLERDKKEKKGESNDKLIKMFMKYFRFSAISLCFNQIEGINEETNFERPLKSF